MNMFLSPMKESESEKVDIKASPEAFEALLQYIYTDEFELDSEEHLVELLGLADQYILPEVKYECEDRLTELIEVDNACDMFYVGHLYSKKLLKESIAFIGKNFKAITQTDGYNNLKHSPDILLTFTTRVVSSLSNTSNTYTLVIHDFLSRKVPFYTESFAIEGRLWRVQIKPGDIHLGVFLHLESQNPGPIECSYSIAVLFPHSFYKEFHKKGTKKFELNEGWGFNQFLPTSELKDYVKDNHLKIKVTVSLMSNNKQ